jgi:hypothetical protein
LAKNGKLEKETDIEDEREEEGYGGRIFCGIYFSFYLSRFFFRFSGQSWPSDCVFNYLELSFIQLNAKNKISSFFNLIIFKNNVST